MGLTPGNSGNTGPVRQYLMVAISLVPFCRRPRSPLGPHRAPGRPDRRVLRTPRYRLEPAAKIRPSRYKSRTRGMTNTRPHQRPVAQRTTTITAIQTASSSRITSDDFLCRRSQFTVVQCYRPLQRPPGLWASPTKPEARMSRTPARDPGSRPASGASQNSAISQPHRKRDRKAQASTKGLLQ
jgi:hypothetical protein